MSEDYQYEEIVRGPFIDSQIVQLAKDGFYKMWSCICPLCAAENIADGFSDAMTGANRGDTMLKANWHKDGCPFISKGVYTKFSAYVVYVR